MVDEIKVVFFANWARRFFTRWKDLETIDGLVGRVPESNFIE